MKWPWVSRAALDFAEHEMERLHEQIALLNQSRDDMVDRLMAMKKEGFNPPAVMAPPEEVTPLPQEIIIAIANRSAPNSPEWRQLTRQARMMVEAEIPTADIEAGILRGEEVGF